MIQYTVNITKLQAFLDTNKYPKYRFNQLTKNYYCGRYGAYSEMTDLPKSLRQELEANVPFFSIVEDESLSSTKSTKSRLKLEDGSLIETVLMDYDEWLTACVSCQVGCPLGCTFCATGKMGFKRNLTAEEIVDQILYWNHKFFPKYVGRVVFMGMGEPFLNWDNLIEALKIINESVGIGARKTSISTAGMVPKIKEFADLDIEINLAVSLHSLNQSVRSSIMPIAKQYPLPKLLEALTYYTKKTRRQIFLEYALIKDVNDSPKDLKLVTDLLKSNKLFYLNLIPLNPVKGGLVPSSKLAEFQKELDSLHLNYSVRQSIGGDIESACGQLIVSSE